MSGTKLVGWLLIVVAIGKAAIDVFDGNGFDWNAHYLEIVTALGGAGLIRGRMAIDKLMK